VTRALIDTHALVWWFEGREKLSSKARTVIEDAEGSIYVSAASAWELAIKSKIGKFRSRELVDHLDTEITSEGFIELPISIEHALRAGSLRGRHKDPFDRMLIAQAQTENVSILSVDRHLDGYGVDRIW
jgi:PIN domain nuclease of toxin-antitoxin system